jgi:UDP-glucose 4-epimerase
LRRRVHIPKEKGRFLVNVAVTGGAGFIGSHLVEALVREGYCVRVIDNFSTGSRDNLLDALGDIELLDADIRDIDGLMRTLRGIDVVYHLAAVASVPYSLSNPVGTHDVNASGTLNTLVAARDAGVSRVVFASSSAVYSNPSATLQGDTNGALEPRTPYGASKLAGELYMKVFCSAYGLETICLRYFNVYGPRQLFAGEVVPAIPAFIKNAVAGLPVAVTGDGSQTRDFVFVDDVVKANVLAIQAERLNGESVDIGTGLSVTIADVPRMVCSVLGREILIDHVPARDGEVRFSQASTAGAQRLLGFRATVGLEEGLRRTIEWISRSLRYVEPAAK